jgi:hypothetical protein
VIASPAFALDEEASGRVEVIDEIGFQNYPDTNIRIWLPPGYDDGAGSFPVLYLLDGQYAFEADSDGINFATDRRMAQLAASRRCRQLMRTRLHEMQHSPSPAGLRP